MAEKQYYLKFDGSAAADVDAYLEYRRIVGDDDGGELFTPEQYEQYKKERLPQRLKNRLFTSWTNSAGVDCKLVGPETPCFCQHRYKQHRTDFAVIPQTRPILLPCQVERCRCASYHYVPLAGCCPIRCNCKHQADEHSEVQPYQCKRGGCQKCTGFASSYTCSCGEPFTQHQMITETKAEREARGHPVGVDTTYKAMGGLTGFSSLAEGYMRLDPSGQGVPQEEFLAQDITAQDHPFLRAAVPSIQARRQVNKQNDKMSEDMAESITAMRLSGESEMDYYERRYQQRLKAERASKRGVTNSNQLRPAPQKAPDKTARHNHK